LVYFELVGAVIELVRGISAGWMSEMAASGIGEIEGSVWSSVVERCGRSYASSIRATGAVHK